MARSRLTDTQLVLMLTGGALAVRLYLVFTSFCISADGPVYIRMAREFAAGEPAKAMAAQFSPLYPWLIALLHPAVPRLGTRRRSDFGGVGNNHRASGLSSDSPGVSQP